MTVRRGCHYKFVVVGSGVKSHFNDQVINATPGAPQTSMISLQMCFTVAILIRCAWEPGSSFFPIVESMSQPGQKSLFLFCKE